MRVAFIAASIALLAGLLTGCGGGSKSVSTTTRQTVNVSITIQWPTAGRGTSRVIPEDVHSVLLEVLNGTVPVVSPVSIPRQPGQTQVTVSVPVPSTELTFYANAYPDAAAPNYVTNPATGLPAAPANDPSLARGVTTVNVTSDPNQAITFTMNNTIVSLLPNVTGQPVQPYQTVALNNGTNSVPGALGLANLMTARDAQGNTVMLPDSAVTWQVDTRDPLGPQKAQVNGLTLNLIATGTVNLIATDTEVNPGQQQIQGAFPLLITPIPTTTTITANVTQIPASARSVTLAVTYDALGATDTLPAAPAPVTVGFNPGTTTAQVNLNFNNNGRKLKLTAEAWSNADGTGTFLGYATLDQQSAASSPFTLPLTPNLISQPVTIQ